MCMFVLYVHTNTHIHTQLYSRMLYILYYVQSRLLVNILCAIFCRSTSTDRVRALFVYCLLRVRSRSVFMPPPVYRCSIRKGHGTAAPESPWISYRQDWRKRPQMSAARIPKHSATLVVDKANSVCSLGKSLHIRVKPWTYTAPPNNPE